LSHKGNPYSQSSPDKAPFIPSISGFLFFCSAVDDVETLLPLENKVNV